MRPFLPLLLLLLVLPALTPPTSAQLPPTPLDPVLAVVERNTTRVREVVIGPELSREDVDIELDMDFRSVDFDTLNVIFGGGRFEATARISARIDMRVISASRVQAAIEGVAPGVGNATALGIDPRSSFIPADAFRASFAGEALRAFQDEQEERLRAFIMTTIPNVTVLTTEFEWSNVSPQDSFERRDLVPSDPPDNLQALNDPTFPPLTLRATVDVQYLERTNLISIIEKALEPQSEREKERKREVADAAADYERSAFSLLGIRQVLDMQAFQGWNLRVRVTLPDGYTFEEASPDVIVAPDLRRAEVLTLGRDASTTVVNPVALTLSNRFLVSTALLAAVLLCGAVLRFPVIIAANAWRRRMRH